VTLPEHPFEDKMLDKARETAWQRLSAATSYINLVEVFVDDFIGATTNSTMKHLEHFSRAMLFGVHSIFPPPEVSGHHGQDPVSQKKMDQGEGLWETTKEILGWLVDGAKFTVQLMPDKVDKICKLINKQVCKAKTVSKLRYQELAGKIQHASFGVPGGKGLFSPVHSALKTTKDFIVMTPLLKQTLKKMVHATRTKQFQIQDIGFWKDGKILPRDSSLHILETAGSCTMKNFKPKE